MKDFVNRNHLFFLLFALTVALAASDSWAVPVPADNAAAGPEFKAMELGGGYEQNTGDLQFMNDKLLFTSSKGKADSLSLEYASLRKVEFKAPRLLKIETANGEEREFTTIGAERFDSKTVAYLRDHLASTVGLKSHIK
jgi:hypothetical protein